MGDWGCVLLAVIAAIEAYVIARSPREVIKVIEVPVEAPTRAAVVPIAAPKKVPTVRVRFMDGDERTTVSEKTVDATVRRPKVVHDGQMYQCTGQADDGAWVYRRVAK